MENQIIINIPEGKKAIQETDKDGNIIIKYVDIETVCSKSWEEFCKNHPTSIGDYYIASESGTIRPSGGIVRNDKKHYLASKEDAEGILALIQLTRLHDEWVGDWKPNGHTTYSIFYNIVQKVACIGISTSVNTLLCFQDKKTACKFKLCFEDLIEKAKKFI